MVYSLNVIRAVSRPGSFDPSAIILALTRDQMAMRERNCILLFAALAVSGFSQERGVLRAGAARLDITPAENAALPLSGYADRTQGFQGIHDHIYARAVVLDDGSTQAAIIACELIAIPNGVWERVSERISHDLSIPTANILLAGEHTHGAPSLRGGYTEVGPDSAAYTAKIEDAIVAVVRQAQANLQPARVGAATGQASVNINRVELTPARGWWLGYNPGGPSDKTVAVVKFESAAGEPIAIFANYPVHGVVMGGRNLQLTGDLPGATSRFVERHFHDKTVVLWTSGAAGDQNPVSRANGSDFTLVEALGQILGEEVVRVADRVRTSPKARIGGVQRVVTCPGRRVEPGPRPRKEYKFTDSDPVNIRLSLLMIDDVALAGVSGEVMTMIGQRLKRESPLTNTIMVTHANGSSGYIPDDAAFARVSYEITTSHLKPGCAENAIVKGLLEMIGQE